MMSTCDMNKGEMESEDRYNPAINASARGYIRIRKHAFNVSCIDFDDKVSNAYEIELKCSQSLIKAVNLELGL
jgi:hypothetical protein